jgi:hypothetical protein
MQQTAPRIAAPAWARRLVNRIGKAPFTPGTRHRGGAPLRVDGDGVTVLVNAMANGSLSPLGFGPDPLWAREVLAGAERDLLPH